MIGIGRSWSWKTAAFIAGALAMAMVLAVRDLSHREPAVIELPRQMMRLEGLYKGTSGVLEVPLIRYEGTDDRARGVKLDYIGAVHIGDASYYRDLNRRFKEYEGVLYELVADSKRIRELNSKTATSGLGWFQKRLSTLVGLSFQLELVDYQAPNFIHADLSPSQLEAAMRARGETFLELLWKMVTVSIDPSVQQRAKEIEGSVDSLKGLNPLLLLLRGPTPREQLTIKRFLARGMLDSESFLEKLEGENGLALIHDRNKAVVEVVRRELSSGKKHMAIFYGAAHLADMHKRLTDEFGFRITAVEWLPAWTIPALNDPNRLDSASEVGRGAEK